MGLFKGRKRFNTSGVSNPAQWLIDIFSGKRGEHLSPQEAMESSSVYACISLIAEVLASLPLILFKDKGDGRERAKDHFLYYLLKVSPNPLTTAFTFWTTVVTHVLMHGNAYVLKKSNLDGSIESLWPLDPLKMAVRVNIETRNIEYLYDNKMTYLRDEIMHIPALAFDGIVGRSVIGLAKQAILLGLKAEDYVYRFFEYGINSKLLLLLKEDLDPEQKKQLRESFQFAYAGSQNSHRPVLIPPNIETKELATQNNKDAAIIDARKFQLEEACRIFRVPLILVQNTDRATFNNSEHVNMFFVQYCLTPWAVRIEQCITKDLLQPLEKLVYYPKFNMTSLLRGDNATRAEYYSKALNFGWLSRNEVRALEEMNQVDDGDEIFIPVNQKPLKQAFKEMELVGKEKKDG